MHIRFIIQRLINTKKDILAVILFSVIVQTISVLLPGYAYALDSYEGYYLFLGNYPHDKNPGWHEDVQGIAHDLDNWFITQTFAFWKIPVTHDLNQSVLSSDPGVIKIDVHNTGLNNEGYNHFGDLEYYEYNGQGYVFVSVECIVFNTWPVDNVPCDSPPPAFAVFNADDLSYIDHVYAGDKSATGWCAVDPTNGDLYSFAGDNNSYIYKYTVDWNALKSNNTLILTNRDSVYLYDENGSPLTSHRLGQGGVISPSGEMLYLIGGFYDELRPDDGIHVFDLTTGRRIQRSTNGNGYFNYEWHPGSDTYDEPEGLTIWDLDADGRAPGISGQLHVLMLDNDITSDDDVYLKHYTLNISVDKNYTGVEDGTTNYPFNTVNEAINFYPAWDGAQVKIQAGTYPETLSTPERVRIISNAGTSIIGK